MRERERSVPIEGCHVGRNVGVFIAVSDTLPYLCITCLTLYTCNQSSLCLTLTILPASIPESISLHLFGSPRPILFSYISIPYLFSAIHAFPCLILHGFPCFFLPAVPKLYNYNPVSFFLSLLSSLLDCIIFLLLFFSYAASPSPCLTLLSCHR